MVGENQGGSYLRDLGKSGKTQKFFGSSRVFFEAILRNLGDHGAEMLSGRGVISAPRRWRSSSLKLTRTFPLSSRLFQFITGHLDLGGRPASSDVALGPPNFLDKVEKEFPGPGLDI
jgi:hypothetical protein